MSRSFKKSHNFKLKNDRWFKRYHNHKIRQCNDVFKNNQHKQIGDSWAICDFHCFLDDDFMKQTKETDVTEYHRLIGK